MVAASPDHEQDTAFEHPIRIEVVVDRMTLQAGLESRRGNIHTTAFLYFKALRILPDTITTGGDFGWNCASSKILWDMNATATLKSYYRPLWTRVPFSLHFCCSLPLPLSIFQQASFSSTSHPSSSVQ